MTVADFLARLDLPTGDTPLFEQALTHSSVEGKPDYERLEFLGDAVLKLVVSQWIFERFPELPEGEMTKIRARLVSDATLAAIATGVDLQDALSIGRAEDRTGGKRKVGTLASSMEAVLAATHLTYGLDAVSLLIRRLWERELASAAAAPGAENAKALLQEATQEVYGRLPVYRVVGGEGPQHHYTFIVEVEVEGRVIGHGRGPTKKQAEQVAAAEALAVLEREGICRKSS